MRILFENDDVCFAATTIEDGNFRVPSGDIEEYATRVRGRLQAFDRAPSSVAVARLCHGTTIARVTECGPSCFSQTDGLVTSIPSLALVVTGGDCAPIFVFDEECRMIGLAHSGRKGTLGDTAAQLVEKMRNDFGTSPGCFSAIIGPGICGAHYSVPREMSQVFCPTFPHHVTPSQRFGMEHLELRGIIHDQLMRAGLASSRITLINECTYEKPETWFSYRRDRQERRDPDDVRVQAFIGWIKSKD